MVVRLLASALLAATAIPAAALAQVEPVDGNWRCWKDKRGDRYCRVVSTIQVRRVPSPILMPRPPQSRDVSPFRSAPPPTVRTPTLAPPIQTIRTPPPVFPQRRRPTPPPIFATTKPEPQPTPEYRQVCKRQTSGSYSSPPRYPRDGRPSWQRPSPGPKVIDVREEMRQRALPTCQPGQRMWER